MSRGDHIFVKRLNGVWEHHGIDCGDGFVIHYNRDSWTDRAKIAHVPLKKFLKGGELQVRDYSKFNNSLRSLDKLLDSASESVNKALDQFRGISKKALDLSEDTVISRAESRLGEANFDLYFNNCEHFASWCKTGISNSHQVNAVWKLSLKTPAFMQYRFQSAMLNIFDSPVSKTFTKK